MNLNAVDLSILLPAMVAGLLVTATHVPLGMQVLDRGIVFIDLAVAQIPGEGVILADYLGSHPSGAAVPRPPPPASPARPLGLAPSQARPPAAAGAPTR